MSQETGPSAPTEPLLRVVSGNPSDEELAVVIALFASAGAPAAPAPKKAGGWADKRALLRGVGVPGPGAWAAAARQR